MPTLIKHVSVPSYEPWFYLVINERRPEKKTKTRIMLRRRTHQSPMVRIAHLIPTDCSDLSWNTCICYGHSLLPLLQDWQLQVSVAQLDAPSNWRPGGRGFNPHRGRQHSFVEIDHEIFSTVILSLPLIQEGQLLVSGERMCTILVNRLED